MEFVHRSQIYNALQLICYNQQRNQMLVLLPHTEGQGSGLLDELAAAALKAFRLLPIGILLKILRTVPVLDGLCVMFPKSDECIIGAVRITPLDSIIDKKVPHRPAVLMRPSEAGNVPCLSV